MVGLVLAVGLPTVSLQLYKIYIGPIGLGIQLGVGLILSILVGLALYLTYRSSARNHS